MKEVCLCPQTVADNMTFECTTFGAGITLWKGTAFNCITNSHEIALRHSLFLLPGGASGQCNNGNITGHSLRIEKNYYTSQLHIMFSPDLVGLSIECIHDNVNSVPQIIGNSTIEIITGKMK